MTDMPVPIPTGCCGYLAAEGFEDDLRHELPDRVQEHGRLFLAPGAARPVAWALNVWHDVVRIPTPSIGMAAKSLRAIQRNWWPYTIGLHRRSALLVDKLPKVSAKPLVFGVPAPQSPLGSFTLLDEQALLAAAQCSSPFPNGELHFVEDKQTPPNRAYLKLWDVFTRLNRYPQPGETCLDLGACPGGWSWVMATCGARVISVDKAPLDPKIAQLPNISCLQESAFGLDPSRIGPVDWLFSDIICYPERLLSLIQRWQASGLVKNYVCTLKFQGATDHQIAAAFAAIPGSRLIHLFHNKHELTWMLLDASIS